MDAQTESTFLEFILYNNIYHITPLSGISTFSASSPLITVLTSFTMGIIMGLIFR